MVTHFFLSDVSLPLLPRKISAKGHASTKHVLRIFQRATQPRHPPKQRLMRSDECPRVKALRKADRSPIRLPHFSPRLVREEQRAVVFAVAKPELRPGQSGHSKPTGAEPAGCAEYKGQQCADSNYCKLGAASQAQRFDRLILDLRSAHRVMR